MKNLRNFSAVRRWKNASFHRLPLEAAPVSHEKFMMRSNSKTASHPLVELFTLLTLSALVPCVNPEKNEEKNPGMFSGVTENNAETFSPLASQSVFRNTSSSLQREGGRNTAETFCTRMRKQTSSFLSASQRAFRPGSSEEIWLLINLRKHFIPSFN